MFASFRARYTNQRLSEASSLTPSSNSFHSKRTKGASGSPFPWYFARIARASSLRPTAINHRGDWMTTAFRGKSTQRCHEPTSGSKKEKKRRMAAGIIWMASGTLHDVEEFNFPVATVSPAVAQRTSEGGLSKEDSHTTKNWSGIIECYHCE